MNPKDAKRRVPYQCVAPTHSNPKLPVLLMLQNPNENQAPKRLSMTTFLRK